MLKIISLLFIRISKTCAKETKSSISYSVTSQINFMETGILYFIKFSGNIISSYEKNRGSE